MVWHDQAGDDFAFDDVALHNFGDVGFGLDTVPDALRIDHNTGSLRAMVETAGLVGSHDILQIETLGFLLEMSVQGF